MRRKLQMTTEYKECSSAVTAGLAARGLVELIVSLHAPELCRAVRDTPGALVEARRVLSSNMSDAQLAQQRELAEIAALEAEVARRRERLAARA